MHPSKHCAKTAALPR